MQTADVCTSLRIGLIKINQNDNLLSFTGWEPEGRGSDLCEIKDVRKT